jgi:hypothetical protein
MDMCLKLLHLNVLSPKMPTKIQSSHFDNLNFFLQLNFNLHMDYDPSPPNQPNPPIFMVIYRMLLTIGVTNFTLVKV